RAERSLADVDAPSVRRKPKADIEGHRLGSHLEHVREGRGVLRRLDAEGGESVRAEFERPGALERGKAPVSRDTDFLPVAKSRMVGGEPRQVLHRGPDASDRLKPVAS